MEAFEASRKQIEIIAELLELIVLDGSSQSLGLEDGEIAIDNQPVLTIKDADDDASDGVMSWIDASGRPDPELAYSDSAHEDWQWYHHEILFNSIQMCTLQDTYSAHSHNFIQVGDPNINLHFGADSLHAT